MAQSICPSVRPSVTPFSLCSHHHIIMKFSGFITIDRIDDVHSKGQGQRSKVKITEVKTPHDSFGTVLKFEFTNYYEMMYKAWSSIGEVPYCFSRSSVKFQGHTGQRITDFNPNWVFPDCNSSLNSLMAMRCCTKPEVAQKICPIVFQGHSSNVKVTWDKKSLILSQIWRFRTVTPVWIHRWLWNVAQSLKQQRRDGQ